jgi:hypothetical protein
MRFPFLFRRSSRFNDEAKETVENKTAEAKRVEKDEKTVISVERSSSSVRRAESDSVSTQGSPAVLSASVLVDKLPHEYERENAGHPCGGSSGHRSTKKDFMEKLQSLSQQHIDEIPVMRRAMLLRRSATKQSRSTCDPPSTMQVTPAVPTTEELEHMEALRAKSVSKTHEEIADTATMFFCDNGCGTSSCETPIETGDYSTPMHKFSEGTVAGGPSEDSPTTFRTPDEISLDRIFANLAERNAGDEFVPRYPEVSGHTEGLVSHHLKNAQKEHCDQSWGGSTISSRVTRVTNFPEQQ